jgi:alpha-tubulin suppressor-like RCC1 family protein
MSAARSTTVSQRIIASVAAFALVAVSHAFVPVSSASAQGPVELWAWGDHREGQLGIGDRCSVNGNFCAPDDVEFPTQLPPEVTGVAAGDLHALATDGSRVWNWGQTDRLASRDGDPTPTSFEPVQLGGPVDDYAIVAVAAGDAHSLALDSDGYVWSWGLNDEGQLGHGHFDGDGGEDPFVRRPEEVLTDVGGDPEPLSDIVAIAAGGSHSLALDREGRVWSWGANFAGQLGNGDAEDSIPYARLVLVDADSGSDEVLSGIAHIAAGGRHSLAVSGSYGGYEFDLYAWGDGSRGQTGLGDTFMTTYATWVQVFREGVDPFLGVEQLAAGENHSLLLTTEGRVLSAGDNARWQLGRIHEGEVPISPRFADVPSIGDASAVAAAGDFSLAIEDGTVLAWGDNTTGQLGDTGGGDPRLEPTAVEGPAAAIALGAGRSAGYAIQGASDPPPFDPALALTVEDTFQTSSPPGVDGIDLSTVDISTLPLFQGELGAAPLRSTPLRSTPLRSTPLRSTDVEAAPLRSTPLRSTPLRSTTIQDSPLRSTPLRSTPLRSTPLRSTPLRSTPLSSTPLSQVPFIWDDGWAGLLACPPGSDPSVCVDTPFAGVALQTVRLGDVLDLLGQTPMLYPQLADLTMDDVDWSNSDLRRASIVGFLFGGLTLDQLGGAATFCGALPGFCGQHGVDGDTLLIDLDLLGAPMGELGLASIEIADIDWSGKNTPAYHYDLLYVDVARSRLASIPVTDLPDGICQSYPAELQAPGFECTGAALTLADAIAAGAIPDYDIHTPTPAILGRILERDELVSGGDEAPLTVGDVLRMIVDPARLSYEDVSLFRLLSGQPVEGSLVTYRASASIVCDDIDDFSLRVTLPPGFRYAPGTSALALDGAFEVDEGGAPEPREAGLPVELPPGAEPTPQRQPLTFDFDDRLACEEGVTGATLQLSFDAQPYVRLSPFVLEGPSGFASSLQLLLGDDPEPAAVLEDTALVSVFDPDDGAREIEPGTLNLGWLPTFKPEQEFIVTLDGRRELPRGTQVTAVLGHLPADFDLRIDGPSSAPLRSTPLRSTPLRSTPLRSTPMEDEGLSGDPAGQQVSSDTLQDVPTTDDSLSVSANRGTEPDVVTTIVTSDTSAADPLTLTVSSYLGSASDEPFSLQIFVEEPPELSCDPTARNDAFTDAFPGGSRGTLPSVSAIDTEARTLVLYNQQRLVALYGTDAVDGILDAWAEVAAADAILDDDHQVRPLLFPVDGHDDVHDAYSAWDDDPCEPEAANDVVRAILEVTDPYIEKLPDLRYVTIIGNDDIVPSARIPDLVTLSNQRDYYPETVFGGVDNPLSAAHAMSYVTSDSAYTDLDPIDWLGHQLLIPDLAGGRLVETPDEIVATIDQYLERPYVKMDSSLVTAYDFLTHGGEETQATFEDLVGATNARSLISEDWERADVLNELGFGPDLIAINAHYDHSRSLPAIGEHAPIPASELFTTADLFGPDGNGGTGPLLTAGAMLFTVGCNAGINVPALSGVGLSPNDARLLDWAQAVAQSRGAGLFANTGFGYGDTTYSGYSERLMSLFATYLDGGMTVGQATVAARKAYVAERGLLGVYDDKVLTESTLYGLPFMRVGATGTSLPADAVFDPFAGDPDTGPPEQDAATLLQAAPFDLAPFPANVEDARVQTVRGDYFEVDGHQPLSVHYRPLQPSMQLTLPEPETGQSIGDVLITGLESTVVDDDIDAVFVRPTVDQSDFEPEPIIRDVAFPSTIGTITPEASLIVLPGQYRGQADPSTGQQILYTRVQGKVFYPSDGPGAMSLGTRPTFSHVRGVRDGAGGVDFEVRASDATFVSVLYRTPPGPGGVSEWRGLELTDEEVPGSGTWTGSVTDDVLEFFVQGVSADGLVGAARGKGFDFLPLLGDAADDDEGPEIVITVPSQGQIFTVGEIVDAQFSCIDGGSGVRSCEAQEPIRLDTSPGPHSFTIVAFDNAGNRSEATVAYSARYDTDGFEDPVRNLPIVNEVSPGRTIPLKFELRRHDGSLVTDLSAVAGLASVPYPCNSSDPAEPADQQLFASGKTELRLVGGTFQYNWQTERQWRGTCREVQIKIEDGNVLRARFRFR